MILKYKLKPKKELEEILRNIEELFIISCNRCYLPLINNLNENEQILKTLQDLNKRIVKITNIDFLCNAYLTKKKIKEISPVNGSPIAVSSCGIGIQVVHDIFKEKEVYSLTDTITYNTETNKVLRFYHGIVIPEKTCAACGNCYLNLTGGICPIVDCSKGLLNGPCGGTTNTGKCEIDKTRDCAWVNIYKKIKDIDLIEIRDYSIPSVKVVEEYRNKASDRRLAGFYGGVYPDDAKDLTKNIPISPFPLEPKFFIIPLSQHTGKISIPIVKPGNKVKVGQKIGESQDGISANIHSSISGKVLAVEKKLHPTLQTDILSVVIENDGKYETDPSIQPYDIEKLTPDGIINIIKEKGIVGLGGAMFPTHIKYKPPKPVDIFIVNCCECEPYLNCDYRIIVEFAYDIISGIDIVNCILNFKKIFIAIEDNKENAVEIIRNALGKSSISNLTEISILKTKYPQGAERMLIKRITDREVPLGGLPFDVGVIVSNVGTIVAISNAINKGIPLIKRVVTVCGEGIEKPGNYEIKIGTPINEILNFCQSKTISDFTMRYDLKMGGPMMGITLDNFNVPVIKGTTGLVSLKKPDIEQDISRDCIRCGRCVDVCPMELSPLCFIYSKKQNDIQKAKEYSVQNCIECGCCDYICSSKLPIVKTVKEIKKLIIH